MKKLYTLQLVPGMVVAENVISYSQQLVISRGTTLTDKLITKLDLYGILSVYVEDTLPTADPATYAPKVPSYSERIRSTPAFQHFKEAYQVSLESFRTQINKVVQKNLPLDVNSLLQHCLDMIADAQGQVGILDMLQNMRDYDDSTFSHSMNVALICNIFATWLKFSQSDIELATACGMLHDVGKLMIPHNILSKPAKLSADEYAQIQKHPVTGYQMLLTQTLDDHIRFAALMHHERSDGSGYPMHLVGDQIDKFARIVAIADVYDAMTAARVYRGPLCPFRVIEIFESEGFQRYDVEYLLIFLENVVNSYIQNRCRLSDGREGDIIYINKEKLSRPIVQCGREYVNLMDHSELFVETLL